METSPTKETACHDEVCITCSDIAVSARLVELLEAWMARVEVQAATERVRTEEVNIELVDADVGDWVLVHAGVAIGKLG